MINFLKRVLRIDRMFTPTPKVADMDTVIDDNMSLMKQIRMKRMKFYKFYNKSQTYYH